MTAGRAKLTEGVAKASAGLVAGRSLVRHTERSASSIAIRDARGARRSEQRCCSDALPCPDAPPTGFTRRAWLLRGVRTGPINTLGVSIPPAAGSTLNRAAGKPEDI